MTHRENPIGDLNQYQVEYNESFQYKFVNPEDLTSSEKDIFQKKDRILEIAGGKPSNVKLVKISETMRIGNDASTAGVWEPSQYMIVIKQPNLTHSVHLLGHSFMKWPMQNLGMEIVAWVSKWS